MFSLYQLNLEKNLTSLSKRLKEHTFHPSEAIKFYKPKENGLLRPFTFIELEDQIVYQAIANILILDFYEKRKSIEHKFVFSNILCADVRNDIFLFRKWNKGYLEYKNNISTNFTAGLIYTAHFDLAAFYDTIDHNSLTSAVIRKNDTPFSKLLADCLSLWANTTTKSDCRKIHHSIPQGPLASCVLAELFLLPIDEKLIENHIIYSRYVDDIVLQSKTDLEIKKAIVLLDKSCKEKGLVPQSSKLEIFKATTAEEAIGKKPSIDSEEKKELFNSDENVLELFTKSMETKNFDSTIIRYILKCYRLSSNLVPLILSEFDKHYEIAEEFCTYLKYFVDEKSKDYILRFKSPLLSNEIPYDYVEKEIWELFSVMNTININIPELTSYALLRVKSTSPEIRYGIYCYLSTAKDGQYMSYLQFEDSSLMQLLQIKFITPEIISSPSFLHCLQQLRKRSSSVLFPILQSHINSLHVVGEVDSLVYISLNLNQINTQNIDSFSHYLEREYEIKTSLNWKKILGQNYKQLNELIYYIYLYKKTDKTAWINLVDTFCDILIKSLIPKFKIWLPASCGWPSITKANGNPADHGRIIQELIDKKLLVNIANNLQLIHQRRCSTPYSHPTDFKTMKESTFVTNSEKNKYFGILKKVLSDIVTIVKRYNP